LASSSISIEDAGMIRLATLVLASSLVLPLGGCAYDYMQRTDRVSYSAGNSVRANLEAQTVNPSKKSMKSKAGLGKDGHVVPETTFTALPPM
jgi:hypothetical protein